MSISGSQEVKTAWFNVDIDSMDTAESVSQDAQEDREVVGVRITSPNLAGSVDHEVRAELFVGTRQIEVNQDSTQDNLSFHVIAHSRINTTNQNAGNDAFFAWFGHGSGIEWNEDSTMTLRGFDSLGAGQVHATVYYREL